jgi:hypothetical protein
MMFRFNYMMLTVMLALSVLFLSSLTISSCDRCTTVLGGLEFWVIYNSFKFVEIRYDFRIETMFGLSVSPVVHMRIHGLFTLFVLGFV